MRVKNQRDESVHYRLYTRTDLSSKLSFVQPKAMGQALHRQPSERVQHAVEAEMKIHTINGIAWLIC